MSACDEVSPRCESFCQRLGGLSLAILAHFCWQDLDITMTVAGYAYIEKDVRGNKDALRYNPSGIPPPKGEHAKL